VAIQTVALAVTSGEKLEPRTFDVLVAGATTPPNPAELIASKAMTSVLQHGTEHYDFVVVDTPPVNAVSDAFPLLRQVNGAIVVGRIGKDRRDIAKQTSEALRGANAPLLGIVANCVPRRLQTYYGYEDRS